MTAFYDKVFVNSVYGKTRNQYTRAERQQIIVVSTSIDEILDDEQAGDEVHMGAFRFMAAGHSESHIVCSAVSVLIWMWENRLPDEVESLEAIKSLHYYITEAVAELARLYPADVKLVRKHGV